MVLTAPFAKLENCVSVMPLPDASCSCEPALHLTKHTLQGTSSAQVASRNVFTCHFWYDKRHGVSCVPYLRLYPKTEFVVKYWSNSKVNFLSISLMKNNVVCFLLANSSTHL